MNGVAVMWRRKGSAPWLLRFELSLVADCEPLGCFGVSVALERATSLLEQEVPVSFFMFARVA